MSHAPLIFIIAGESSGDQLGGDLMACLKELQDVRFAGIGGPAMTAQGLTSLFPMGELSLIGVLEILKNLPHLLKRLNYIIATIQDLKPDVVVTIDAPEFSFRVMKRLHKLTERPRLIHYVAPTVWAWRSGRAKKISRFLDHLLCVYPFEPPYFEKYGLKTTFVGHPVTKGTGEAYFLKNERDPNLLCVLPGSRRSEVEKLLPIFGDTVKLLKKDLPDLKVVIPTLSPIESLIRQGTQGWPFDVKIVLGDEARKEAFQQSSAALAASGTVALQLSAARLPFAIAYKLEKIEEWPARILIHTPWACMVNILLAFKAFGPDFILTRKAKDLVPKPWIPEFIQQDCMAEKLAPSLLSLLTNEDIRAHQIDAMEEALSSLKAPPQAAAKVILEGLYPNG